MSLGTQTDGKNLHPRPCMRCFPGALRCDSFRNARKEDQVACQRLCLKCIKWRVIVVRGERLGEGATTKTSWSGVNTTVALVACVKVRVVRALFSRLPASSLKRLLLGQVFRPPKFILVCPLQPCVCSSTHHGVRNSAIPSGTCHVMFDQSKDIVFFFPLPFLFDSLWRCGDVREEGEAVCPFGQLLHVLHFSSDVSFFMFPRFWLHVTNPPCLT